jgi:SAM-dependent methyltransferase
MNDDFVSDTWHFLTSDEALSRLKTLSAEPDARLRSIAVVSELRATGLTPEHVSALLSQALLRKKAERKFGSRASDMLFTEAGLEQATRAVVAQTHAQRFVRAGVRRVVDLGCGIGAESLALSDAGIDVLSVELDPETAFVAGHNLRYSPQCTVQVGDAEHTELSEHDGAFLDPARRTSGTSHTTRITDTSEYTPSLTFAFSVAEHHPTAVKLGPGFDRQQIPANAHAQWTSVDGEAVEMMLWFGALASEGVTRSALVLRDGTAHEMSAANDTPDEEVRSLGEFIYEPDPAIIRARLLGDLARAHNLGMVSERIAYLTGDTLVSTEFAQAFRVIDVLPASENRLKKALRERNIGTLEIKKRGMDVDPAQLRNRLNLRGDEAATIILTRSATDRVAVLVERLRTSAP